MDDKYKQFYSKDPHVVLGVPKTATPIYIENARKSLQREFHPDINRDPQATEISQNINIAYDNIMKTTNTGGAQGTQAISGETTQISNTEWGLVIGALAVVDATQVGLDLLFQAGVIVNRFIDVGVGMALPFYLQMRGQTLANPKRLGGLVATFVGEEIPDVDALPLWTLDGIYNMMLANEQKILGEVPGANNVVSIASKKPPQSIGKGENADKMAA